MVNFSSQFREIAACEVSHRHCCKAVLSSKKKSALGSVVLQLALLTDEPTVSTPDVPPVSNPVESDMVRRNFCVVGSVSWTEKEPLPEDGSKAESGMEMF